MFSLFIDIASYVFGPGSSGQVTCGFLLPPVMVRQSFRATRDGVTVTYSVCIGGAGIDYSSVTSILYTYSAFSITLRFFKPVG